MTDREKLITIFAITSMSFEEASHLTDILIEMGVTFATDSGAGSKWISVNDRLPEVTGSYLVCTDKDKVCTSKFYIDLPTGLRYEDPHWNNPSMNKHITHWAFLPEPPERKRND